MESFIQRVAYRILPLSQEQLDVKKAFTEWGYTGVCYDLEEPIEDCKLCDHHYIRYQFEIENKYTTNKLLVGSRCIERFEIGGEEGMEKVQADLNKLLESARSKRVLAAFDALIPFCPDVAWTCIHYLEDAGLSPTALFLLLSLLEKHKVPLNPRDLTVRLRAHDSQQQLLEATDAQYQMLLPCLSPAQKMKYPFKALVEHRNTKKQNEEARQKQFVSYYRPASVAPAVSSLPGNVSGWGSKPSTAPSRPLGLKSKYHGKCPLCSQDTFEKAIQLTSQGWTHVVCIQAKTSTAP